MESSRKAVFEFLTGAAIDGRPCREPDLIAEYRHLEKLARACGELRPEIPLYVTEAALELCRASSAGITIRQPDGRFLWLSVAGQMASHSGSVHAAEGPCHLALIAAEASIFVNPDLNFEDRRHIHPAIFEELHVPIRAGDDVSGTLWVAVHDDQRQFDREDVRILTTLAGFSAGVLLWMARERLRQRLDDSEQRLREITEYLRDIVWLANISERRFVYVSPGCRRIRGQAPEALLGDFEEWFRPIPPADREQVRAAFFENSYQGTYEIEYPILHPDGSCHWVYERAVPIDDTGRVAGITEDITDRKLVEFELRETSERLRRQVENSPMAVIEFDTASRITGWSRNAERIFGWTAEEIIGREMADVHWVYEADLPAVKALSRSLETKEQTTTVSHNRNYRKDGQVIWCEWYNSALLDENGNLKSLLSFVLDVSERKQTEAALRESQERLALAQNAGGIGTFESYVDTGRVVWTETLERLFGLEPGTFEGRIEDWRRRVHPDDLQAVNRIIRQAVSEHQREIEYEFRAILPSGEYRILYTRAVMFYDDDTGRLVRLLGINMDVTEQRRAQQEREHLLAEAQREITRRHEVERQLRRSNEDLQQFAYSASHDLQEPLRTVAVYSQLLQRRYSGRLDDNADRFLGFISDSAQRMESLLRDLLEYTRIATQTRMEIQELDSGAVLSAVLEQLRSAIAANDAIIETGPMPMVRIWPVHLHQLFQNLIGNALKYRGAARPAVRVSAATDAAFHTFSVADNGIGIDPQYQKQIFGIFKRLHTHAQYPGTGMGLAICQKIVEGYGGRIWVEGALGEGSTFRFTLPVETKPDQE